MQELLVEAVCCSVEDCVEAEGGGVGRIELCSAMGVGGLTPSLGTVVEVQARVEVPVVVMIRPRAGGFGYSAGEFAAMRRDVSLVLGQGVAGIVCGILRPSGEVDVERSGELAGMARAAGREAVFHRAFDVVPEPFAALETLIALGFTRILTSGRQATALAGAALIAELVRQAAGRIEILAGGGLRDTNIAELLRTTGVRQVHLGAFTARPDPSGLANPSIRFSSSELPAEGSYQLTDADLLRRLRAAAETA